VADYDTCCGQRFASDSVLYVVCGRRVIVALAINSHELSSEPSHVTVDTAKPKLIDSRIARSPAPAMFLLHAVRVLHVGTIQWQLLTS